MPLQIAIVGAGLGGLVAALCLSRQDDGHEIKIYEKHAGLTRKGAGIMIRPGASRILAGLGCDVREEFDRQAEHVTASVLRSIETGEITMRSILTDVSEWPDWSLRREEIQQILYSKVGEAGIAINFSSEVEGVNEKVDKVDLAFKDGTKVADFDLVIAADGIRSKIRKMILGDHWVANVTNMTLYGVLLDWNQLAENPVTRALTDDNRLNVWMGKNIHLTSGASNKNGRWSGSFGVLAKSDQQTLWDEDGNIEYVRQQFSGVCPSVKEALERVDKCDRWKIAEVPDLPTWRSYSGRVILLGDAAHGMVPNAAQGFSQTVEDAGVLAYLLQSQPQAPLSSLTKTWETIRKPRVERIKAYAKWNSEFFTKQNVVANDDVAKREKSLIGVRPQMQASFHSAAFNKWALDHDAIAEARAYTSGHEAKL